MKLDAVTILCWLVSGLGGLVFGMSAPDGEWPTALTGIALVLLVIAIFRVDSR